MRIFQCRPSRTLHCGSSSKRRAPWALVFHDWNESNRIILIPLPVRAYSFKQTSDTCTPCTWAVLSNVFEYTSKNIK